jgi:hypothetical protein
MATVTPRDARKSGCGGTMVTGADALALLSPVCEAVTVTAAGNGNTGGAV